jgi:hypothetical protein
MSYHYQIVNLTIDPSGEGAKKLRVHRVMITPQGAELPNIVWPTLRKLKVPVNVEISTISTESQSITVKANYYKERSAKGTTYGIFFLENLLSTKLGERLPWKDAKSRSERRKLPRFSGFPEELAPLSVKLNMEGQDSRDVIIKNVSLNGAGIEFIASSKGSIGAGLFMGETIKLLVEKKNSEGLRLVTEENLIDSPWIELKCEVRRIVEICEKKEEIKFKVGLKIKHDDYFAEQSWKNWVQKISKVI